MEYPRRMPSQYTNIFTKRIKENTRVKNYNRKCKGKKTYDS